MFTKKFVPVLFWLYIFAFCLFFRDAEIMRQKQLAKQGGAEGGAEGGATK